jgi:hypothetical protein
MQLPDLASYETKKTRKKKGRGRTGIRKSNRRGEFDQSTICVYGNATMKHLRTINIY